MDQILQLFQTGTVSEGYVWLIYVASTITTFVLVFVKTLQSRHIVFTHYLAAYITSWGITTMEVTSVSLVMLGGWWVILSAGFGGSLGVVGAMRTHERFFNKHNLLGKNNEQRNPSRT